MPQFHFERQTNFEVTLNENRQLIWKMALNDEWSILCVISGGTPYDPGTINSSEIHRQKTAEEHSISGELKIMDDGRRLIWEKKFSETITTGSQCIKLGSVPVYFLYSGSTYWFNGVVKVSDNCERCTNCLENGKSKNYNPLKSYVELSNHLERLLDPETTFFADVNIKCGSDSIPAHKNILSARSPVFAAMFSNPMKESYNNEVNVTDMDVLILRALLTYMYTGKINDLSTFFAGDLLFAADKYQVDELKKVCCDFLKDSISMQNVLRVVVLGELHDKELKSFAVDYICKNCDKFSVLENLEEWKTLREETPELALDVLSSYVNYRDNN